jgi:hypothetical protein
MSVPAELASVRPNSVETPRNEYAMHLWQWDLVADACAGEAAVKLFPERYLPKPNPHDKSEDNKLRYSQYVKRAVYYNASGRTLSALLGLAFNQDPTLTLPPPLEFLSTDITGSGLSLVQLAQQCLAEVLQMGRAGVLVDYPQTNGLVSKAQQIAGDSRVIVNFYGARDIINWRSVKRGAKQLTALLVLRETWEEDTQWVAPCMDQYRVLRLIDGDAAYLPWEDSTLSTLNWNGKGRVYTQELWRISSQGWYMHEGPSVVFDGAGNPWDEIPFSFIGAHNNSHYIGPIPLFDLCSLNIAHYRNSADYEDSAYIVGQPQFWMSGMDERWLTDLEEKGIVVGSRSILPIPVGGSAGVLQAQPNTLARMAMLDKEQQMASLGARLLNNNGVVKTATQQNSEDASAHSVLTLSCNNVSMALSKCLSWAAKFENVTLVANADGDDDADDNSFEINTNFLGTNIDAPTLSALLTMVQAGKLPESDFWQALRNMELIDPEKTDEEIQEELDSQDPVRPPPLFGGALLPTALAANKSEGAPNEPNDVGGAL